MLVLTRKVEETIRIGPGIEVTIVHIGSNSVRVGITAPDEVEIYRAELKQDAPESETTAN